MDCRKAVSHVRRHGTGFERARLERIIDGVEPSAGALAELAAMQHPDGGFAYWLPDRTISTVCDTAYVLGWLDDLNLREGPIVDRAVRFLFSHQKADGGWDEVEALRRLDVPEFLVQGEPTTRTWLTAYCAHWLMLFGYADAPICRGCPVHFLLKHRDESGRLIGYQRATWDALPIFHRFPQLSGDAYAQALAATERELAPAQWAGSYVAWLLRALRDCRLPADHELVEPLLAALTSRQQADGSWDSESGEQHAVDATIEVLRVLRDFGVV
jgi:hypothetical protein